MKKRTLNQTWTLCLRMWRKISKKWVKGDNIYTLKREWIRDNGFLFFGISANCFFCDYAGRHCDNDYGSCDDCPGKLVDDFFHCENSEYNYVDDPPAFYAELLRLNRIRKRK